MEAGMSAKPDAMNAAQRTGKRFPEMFITYAIIVFIKKTRFFSGFRVTVASRITLRKMRRI